MPWEDRTVCLEDLDITINYSCMRLNNNKRIYSADVTLGLMDRFIISHKSPGDLDELLFKILPAAYYARLNQSSLKFSG